MFKIIKKTDNYNVVKCDVCDKIFKCQNEIICPNCFLHKKYEKQIEYLNDTYSLFLQERMNYICKFGYMIPVINRRTKKMMIQFKNNDLYVQLKCSECGTSEWVSYMDFVMGKTRCSNIYYCPIYNNGNKFVYVR